MRGGFWTPITTSTEGGCVGDQTVTTTELLETSQTFRDPSLLLQGWLPILYFSLSFFLKPTLKMLLSMEKWRHQQNLIFTVWILGQHFPEGFHFILVGQFCTLVSTVARKNGLKLLPKPTLTRCAVTVVSRSFQISARTGFSSMNWGGLDTNHSSNTGFSYWLWFSQLIHWTVRFS